MRAPDGAEVVAQEWGVLVVVVVEAIGPLAAVDPGDEGFSAMRSRWLSRKKEKTEFIVCNSRYGPPVRTEHRLIVENLSSRISWQVRFL